MGTVAGSGAAVEVGISKTGLIVKKITPSVDAFDVKCVTKISSDGCA
jgi:hypothetical protein